MKEPVQARRRGSYGFDAPFFVAFIVVVIAFNLLNAILSGKWWSFLPVVLLLAIASSCLYTTRRGKFVVWADLLNRLNLRGDERILDLGCGRGAVLLMAAQHLTTGKAVGVDIWRNWDQSGNAADATRRNAIAEGVADRIELHTGDITALPLEDNRFDLVVSSLAIHNISGRVGRDKALVEAVRVLRPGGRLVIADIWDTRHYASHLAKLGMSDVARRRLSWHFWWGGPWAPTRLVTATKPERRT
jgi:SAM-dependent methyltransferase